MMVYGEERAEAFLNSELKGGRVGGRIGGTPTSRSRAEPPERERTRGTRGGRTSSLLLTMHGSVFVPPERRAPAMRCGSTAPQTAIEHILHPRADGCLRSFEQATIGRPVRHTGEVRAIRTPGRAFSRVLLLILELRRRGNVRTSPLRTPTHSGEYGREGRGCRAPTLSM
jgi:hypothetical protein